MKPQFPIPEIEIMRAHELAISSANVGPLWMIVICILGVCLLVWAVIHKLLERERRLRAKAALAEAARQQRARETEVARQKIAGIEREKLALQQRHRAEFRARQSTLRSTPESRKRSACAN